MKSRFFTAGLIAAMMVPAAASARTTHHELKRDRHDVRAEKRDVRAAVRHGDRGDVREERRELRDARHEYRGDRRDWRQDRRYSHYRAPFRYQHFNVGVRLRPAYYAPGYRLNYDSRWGLARPGRNLTYVRHYNDLLLVNVRNGRVVRVYRNHFRWR